MGMFSRDETPDYGEYCDLLNKFKNLEKKLEESKQTVYKCVDIIRELQQEKKELEETLNELSFKTVERED